MMCYMKSEVWNSTRKIPEDSSFWDQRVRMEISKHAKMASDEVPEQSFNKQEQVFDEEPQKDLKSFRMNFLPAVTSSTEIGKLPIVVGHLRKKDNSEMPDCSSEAKRELVMIRDIEFMQTLPDPKMDRIFLYFVDRFKPSNLIISLIAEGKSPRPHAILMYELLRLCTLRTYSRNNTPFLTKYAAAGFYYASKGEDGVCYCRGLRRYGWVEADDRMVVHKRINPRCKCIINSSEHNFPAIADGPLRQTVARLDMIPDCIRTQSPGEDVNNSQGTRTGVQLAIPKHPHMAIKTVREQSFNGNWPNTPKYSPLQLADGGFYFTEKPRTDLKNFRTNVLPAVTSSTEIGKLPIVETPLRKKDDSEISDFRSEAKRELAMIRDIILMQKLPDPKMDRIFLYYVDRFNPLNLIISQISEAKLPRPRPQVTIRYDLLPLCTFRTQKRILSTLKPFLTKYAAAGFYYASDGDDDVCYCCGIRRYGWVEAGDPMEVHKRINPRCKFIINNSEHNVPAIADDPLRQTVARLDMIPDCIRAPSSEEDVNNSQGTRTGVQLAIPKHLNMAIKTVSEQSSNGNWSNTPKYSPLQLANGDEPSNYLYNNHLRKAYQSVCNESILATQEIKNGINSAEEKVRNGNLNQLKTYKGLSDELRKRTGIDRLRPARLAKYSEVCCPVNQIITQPIVHQIDMRYELRRFSTFGTYPSDNKPYRLRFAAAGFYFTGDGDAVVCFCCGIRRDGWVKRDVPMVVHRNINPGCQFVINNCDLNVPAVVHMQDRRSISRLEAIPYCSQDCGHGDPVHSCGQGVYGNSVYSDLVSEPAQRAVNAGYSAEQVRDIIIYHRRAYGFGDTSNEVSSTKETSSNRPYNNDSEDIKQENEQLEEQTLCKVCLDNIVSIVFLPCGHQVTCADCAHALRECPICQADVKGTVRTRIS